MKRKTSRGRPRFGQRPYPGRSTWLSPAVSVMCAWCDRPAVKKRRDWAATKYTLRPWCGIVSAEHGDETGGEGEPSPE